MNARKSPDLGKGSVAEHTLAEYFRRIGYFAVRSVPVREQGVDITDIDIWLYNRQSPVGRERINVDSKNKRTPQAMERLLWALGVKTAYGLENCIVATTDKRPVVREFGRQLGVLVLDGEFLSRLTLEGDRLSEEELFGMVLEREQQKLGQSWRERVLEARSGLLTSLDFDGCNARISDYTYFADQAIVGGVFREAAYRLGYICASYFAISLDFALRELMFDEPVSRQKRLEEGFRHGADGAARTESAIKVAATLVAAIGGQARAFDLRRHLGEASGQIRADLLSEYFSRTAISGALFEIARTLDEAAYSRIFVAPARLPQDARGCLSVLLDFSELSRREYFG